MHASIRDKQTNAIFFCDWGFRTLPFLSKIRSLVLKMTTRTRKKIISMSCWVLLSKSFDGWNGGDSLRQCRTACGESRGAKKLQKYLKVCDTCKHWWMSVVQTCVYVNAQSFIQPVRPPSVLFPHSLKRDLLEPVQIGPLKWSLAFSLWCLGKLGSPESSVLSPSLITDLWGCPQRMGMLNAKKHLFLPQETLQVMPACCGSSIFSESKSNSIYWYCWQQFVGTYLDIAIWWHLWVYLHEQKTSQSQ